MPAANVDTDDINTDDAQSPPPGGAAPAEVAQKQEGIVGPDELGESEGKVKPADEDGFSDGLPGEDGRGVPREVEEEGWGGLQYDGYGGVLHEVEEDGGDGLQHDGYGGIPREVGFWCGQPFDPPAPAASGCKWLEDFPGNEVECPPPPIVDCPRCLTITPEDLLDPDFVPTPEQLDCIMQCPLVSTVGWLAS